RTDGKPERHRLQRARLVAGYLEALDLRRDGNAVVPDDVSRPTAALGQQIAKPIAGPNQLDGAQQGVAAAERQPRLVKPAPLDALHGKRDRAARADGVDAELVAAL